jgi:hypothetical protein
MSRTRRQAEGRRDVHEQQHELRSIVDAEQVAAADLGLAHAAGDDHRTSDGPAAPLGRRTGSAFTDATHFLNRNPCPPDRSTYMPTMSPSGLIPNARVADAPGASIET